MQPAIHRTPDAYLQLATQCTASPQSSEPKTSVQYYATYEGVAVMVAVYLSMSIVTRLTNNYYTFTKFVGYQQYEPRVKVRTTPN